MGDNTVIVIGSGPSGAMATSRLVERGVPVTMLDAGLTAPRGMIVRAAGNTMFRWVDRSELEENRHLSDPPETVTWQSSRSHGGLSNYWTGAVPRFAPEDFTEGAAVDERFRWPLTYNELVPYYELAESMVVVTAGPVPFRNVPANTNRYNAEPPADWSALAEGAAAAGHFLGPIPLAKGRPWMVARRATEFNSYHCIVQPLTRAPNFRLIAGAEVTKLQFDSAQGRVVAVEYVDRRSGSHVTVPCQAVVLAAGAIDSTVVLLRSTSPTFPDGLGNSSGLLGRYLHDHPREWWTAVPSRPMTALAHPIYVSRRSYESSEPLMASSLTIGLAERRHRLYTYARRKTGIFGVQVFGTMIPRPDTRVTLADQNGSASVRPQIDLRYDQPTVDNLLSARRRLVDIFAAAGEHLELPGPFHELTPGSSVHFGGSVRMHASPEHGVLDRWNRMHDVPNVVVCDSSCFTTGPEKNPTLTAMAIAARAADHLAEELLQTTGRAAV